MVIVYFDTSGRRRDLHHSGMLSFLFSDPLPVGSLAPDWTMRDQDGNMVAAIELRGKNIVLVFYPRDETPTCRAQFCEFRDAWDDKRSRRIPSSSGSIRRKHPAMPDFARTIVAFSLAGGRRRQSLRTRINTRGLMTKRTVYLIGPMV